MIDETGDGLDVWEIMDVSEVPNSKKGVNND